MSVELILVAFRIRVDNENVLLKKYIFTKQKNVDVFIRWPASIQVQQTGNSRVCPVLGVSVA